MVAGTFTILNSSGFHARPAGLFVKTASRFRSAIKVVNGKQTADGKSILSLMLLGATPGAEITIEAQGEDEAEALHALAELIASGFGEERAPA
jgi:phosphotransferase system HPr (HPr) family protein